MATRGRGSRTTGSRRTRPPPSPRRSERGDRSSSATRLAVADRYTDHGPHATEGFEALIAAPLKAGARLRGAVGFSFEAPHVFTPQVERFVDLLAQQCGLALDRAERTRDHAAELERVLGELRAAQARTLAAADAERRRIERDIHDGAQQRIVAVRVKLSLAESALDSTDPVRAAWARTMIVESGRELESALHDLRLLAHGVFPRILADEGLPSALTAAARQAAIPASVDAAGVGRLPAEIESAVYFCCLEALQNAAKHAGADATRAYPIWRSTKVEGSRSRYATMASGSTPPRRRPEPGSPTCEIASERAVGRSTIESAPGGGTRIRAWVPSVRPELADAPRASR